MKIFVCIIHTEIYKKWFCVIMEACTPGQKFHQRQVIESGTSRWLFMSCTCVAWLLPQPRPFRRLEAVLSPFILTEKWTWSQIMINSFAPLSPFFTRHISSEHSDTKMSFYRDTNQAKINFVRDLSLSQLHILTGFGNRCSPPCFKMDTNGHLNSLTGEIMN